MSFSSKLSNSGKISSVMIFLSKYIFILSISLLIFALSFPQYLTIKSIIEVDNPLYSSREFIIRFLNVRLLS